jgi:hypothetical protein
VPGNCLELDRRLAQPDEARRHGRALPGDAWAASMPKGVSDGVLVEPEEDRSVRHQFV